MRHVIIGASIAGISAARAIISADSAAEVILVSAEKTKPYCRPMIPSLIEDGGIDVSIPEGPKTERTEFVFERAEVIDAHAKEVVLSSGRRISFDKLLVATGSSPFVPDIAGIDGPGVFTFRTMEDARRIKMYTEGRRTALILGGGLVGIKAAIALTHVGLKVTVIEALPHILPRRFDAEGSGIISAMLKNAGIGVITADSIVEVKRESGSIGCRLSSGGSIHADLLIVATGTKPNLSIVRDTGIKTTRGVVVNDSLETNVPNIYAAGDVVEYADIITGTSAVSGLWTNAEEMGRLAGKNMAGSKLKYRGLLSVLNSTSFLTVPAMSIGLIEPEDGGYETVVSDDHGSYRKLVFRDDVLVGAVFIGEVGGAGVYTNLIRNGIPIGSLKEKAVRGDLRYIDFVKVIPEQTVAA